MTPGMWVWTVILAVLAVIGLALIVFGFVIGEPIAIVAGVVLLVIGGSTVWIPHWWQHHTEGGERSLRNYRQTTNIASSPVRVAKVFSATGQLLATYTGRFDVSHNDGLLDFDIHRANGVIQRVLIDDSTAVVTIEDEEGQ